MCLPTFMRAQLEGKKFQIITLVDALSEWEPGFFERLNGAGTHAVAAAHDAKTRLNNGQSNGRSEDGWKVQEAMPKWSARGMRHKECAKQLAPPTLDFTDESVVTKFMVDGDPPMTPECWGSFMWAEGQFDHQQPSNGLLEGELLLSVATAILFSPSSSMPETIQAAGGAHGHTRRQGPIGIAKKYELTQVTPAFIAYVTCVTQHALTGANNFSEVCDGFSYAKFYYLVCGMLEDLKKLFSSYKFCLNTIAPADQANATINMLDTELEGLEITPEVVGHSLDEDAD
ncbi:hypothetical protein FRC10_003142 [Ceratobasidium sp. 414]|nr:hypothetical protein FRC10_003142 [Ceratobasidium sp. 414]